MALEKRLGMGCTLSVDKDAGGAGAYALLGNVVDGFEHGGGDAEDGETTLLADLFKTYEKADIEPGTVTFLIAYDPADTQSILIGDMWKQRTPIPNWKLTYYAVGAGASVDEIFSGYVKSVGRTIRKREMVVCPVTIKLSGDPDFAAT